jgi:hypothetical protein
MTIGDVIDTLVQDASDQGADYRTNAMRWLNIVRSEAASLEYWPSSRNISASFTTSEGIRLYTLAGFSGVIGDEMYDQTSDRVLYSETEATLLRLDANNNETGDPMNWAAAGMAATGDAVIRLWPGPSSVHTINYIAQANLVDLADPGLAVDPYFGKVIDIAPMLISGLRWQDSLFDKEDVVTVASKYKEFERSAKKIAGQSAKSVQTTSRLEPVLHRRTSRPGGRFSSHFDNR